MDVILHGLFGNIQVIPNFFIRHSLVDQRDRVLFAPSKLEPCASAGVGQRRRLRSKVVEQNSCIARGTNGFSLGYGANSVHNRRARSASRLSALACRIESCNRFAKEGNSRQVSGTSDASKTQSGLIRS